MNTFRTVLFTSESNKGAKIPRVVSNEMWLQVAPGPLTFVQQTFNNPGAHRACSSENQHNPLWVGHAGCSFSQPAADGEKKNVTQSTGGEGADSKCTASVPVRDALNGRPGTTVPPFSRCRSKPRPQVSETTIRTASDHAVSCTRWTSWRTVFRDCDCVFAHILRKCRLDSEQFSSGEMPPSSGGDDNGNYLTRFRYSLFNFLNIHLFYFIVSILYS